MNREQETKNYANGPEIPMGFGMALAQNAAAMTQFSNLSQKEREAIIAHTHAISSKDEMKAYVNSLVADQNKPDAPIGIG